MAHSTVEAGVHSYDLKPQKPKLKMQMPARVVDEVGPGTAMMTPITQTLHMSQQMSSSASSSTVKCLDVCVFLRDGSGHEFSVECGKRATAQDLCDLMQANLCLPPVASELFCLWLSSPLLKLQLKPHHVPFKLYRQWPDLLDRFTSATEDQKSRDEPVLIYQRNAFFPKSREKRITDNKILLRLFDEAKDNLLDGYYPCSSEDYDRLAAILARIDHGPFLSRRHTPAFFKNKLSSYYPAHLCKTSWSLPVSSKNTAEYRIVEQYKSLQDNCNNNQYRQMLLDFCWSLPYYGCVFFTGQIEKPCHGSRKVRENPDRLIYIAINRDGVFIIDISKCEVLLSLGYDDLSWEYTEPHDRAMTCLPCLWLQFDIEELGNKVSKLLQVFSKQAVMMNAMIEACVDELNKVDPMRQGVCSTEHLVTDSAADTVDAPLLEVSEPVKCVTSQINRLSLATFSNAGELVHKPNRRPFSLTTLFKRQDSST